MDLSHLTTLASEYVTYLLATELSEELCFHNTVHTGNVVIAAREIGIGVSLSLKELDMVVLAAWFHDTGYTRKYDGHELESVAIAKDFFASFELEHEDIDVICQCILATKFPQSPNTLMEKVLCDADFYHFSLRDYPNYEERLRREWEVHLEKHYPDAEWNRMNLKMLEQHQYFTAYAQQVLEPKKQIQLSLLKARIKNETNGK